MTAENQAIVPVNGVWLLGGAHCGVCQSIKPVLEAHLRDHCPKLTFRYTDCAQAPEVCAQQRVFALPVVRVYFGNKLFLEEVHVFSLSRLFAEIDRLYQLHFDV